MQARLINPFESDGQWHKANLHTHTTTSDGEASPEERVRQYREKGYDILALTDHGRTNDIDGLCTAEFLVLQGMEPGRPAPYGADSYHLVCLNIPRDFEVPDGAGAQEIIDLAKGAGGEVILAHPYWCGLNINSLNAVNGYVAIEVFNSTCTKVGKGTSSVQWDDLLNAGTILPAVAVDDVHRGRDIFMGWTVMKLRVLTADAVMEAVRTGCFYSSCGPTIEDFRVVDGVAMLRCSPVVEASFICETWHGQSFFADDADPITEAEFNLREGTRYVRAEVVDDRGRRAWTNPIVFE